MADRRIISKIKWDGEAPMWCDYWGISQADAESIVRFPGTSVLDPHSAKVGWPVIRHRRGDVIITTGYRERTEPTILHVFVETGEDFGRGSRQAAAGATGSTLPRTWIDLKKRILSKGHYEIRYGGHHEKVIDKETGDVLMTLPGTTSDWRAMANAWRQFVRRHHENEKARATKLELHA